MEDLYEELKETEGWHIYSRHMYIITFLVLALCVTMILMVHYANSTGRGDKVFDIAVGIATLIALFRLCSTIKIKPFEIKKGIVSNIELKSTKHRDIKDSSHVSVTYEYIIQVNAEGILLEGKFPCARSSGGAKNPQNIQIGDTVFWFKGSDGICTVVK